MTIKSKLFLEKLNAFLDDKKREKYVQEKINESTDVNTIIKKGKKIAIDTMNTQAGYYYTEYDGEVFWIKGNKANNQGDTKEFVKKVKAGKLKFIKLT